MNFRPVFFVVGILCIILSALMLIPSVLDFSNHHPDYKVFLSCSMLMLFIGGLLYLSFRNPLEHIDIKQAFFLTALSWVSICFFAAIPLYFSNINIPFVDAFFEVVSAITTTGSSVLKDLDHAPQGVLMWRGLLMGLGGIGIIVFAIAILPLLHVGGMQLFKTESSDISPKMFPRTAQIAAGIIIVYSLLVALCAGAFFYAGMSIFDAINHALGTVSTAGLSTHDQSFSYFENKSIHWIGSLFMLSGALPFLLYYRALKGEMKPFFQNEEVRFYLKLLVIAIMLVFVFRYFQENKPALDILREVVFNTTSLLTTTGYGVSDFTLWGAFPITLFAFLMLIGGCTGSTAGGIKAFRIKILTLFSQKQMKQLTEPQGVFIVQYNQKLVSDSVLSSVANYFFIYLAVFAFFWCSLALIGFDFLTAFGCVATSLGNVGPGLTPETGPLASWSSFPDSAKWLLSLAMIMGRLEILTVLIIMLPSFWKN
jgi:trk system potassium uptake protein